MANSEVATWVAIGKDIVVGVSAASAAIFAFLGLSAWRKELKGKAEYELAKNVLKSVYRVREAFKHVRNPAIFQYEYPADMVDHHGHLKDEHVYKGTAHVYEERWKIMDQAFRELEEFHLAAQVEWGSEFQDKITKLRSCRATLLVTIQQFLERKKDSYYEPNSTVEERMEQDAILYNMGSDSKYGKFTLQVDEAIDSFEKWLRPHIGRR